MSGRPLLAVHLARTLPVWSSIRSVSSPSALTRNNLSVAATSGATVTSGTGGIGASAGAGALLVEINRNDPQAGQGKLCREAASCARRPADGGLPNNAISTGPVSSRRLRVSWWPSASKAKSGTAGPASAEIVGPIARDRMPAARARMKLIRSQRSAGLSVPAKPGIAPFAFPWLIHQNRSPSLCAKRWGAVKSAGRTASAAAAGPSPSPPAPWQNAQFSTYSRAPCSTEWAA